ncbi:MAG: ABC transporter ATP-binding protein [Chloroflexota bacterium]|nr:ABC transporter ATP-binding protein [Chloroflexota bacterium]
MTSLLELQNVTKVYSGGLLRRRATVALEDNYVSIGGSKSEATILAIAGESGSGKTTMGMLLLGFIEPTSGKVLYKGQDLWESPKDVWRDFRRQVQAIFQDPFEVYNPFYKVDHMLTTPVKKFGLADSRAEQEAIVEKALTGVGLRPGETLGRYPHQLSGGQRQRVTVARALLLDPKVIIADEPVSMVDASLRATILKSLRRLKNEMGISILYITHDLATAYHICEDIMILYQGSVVEAGDVETVIMDPQHPYTKLLVSSIPWPDPNRRWGEPEDVTKGQALAERGTVGCKFAPRCPQAMDICHEKRPSLFWTGDTRAVSCFLYQDSPVVQPSEINKVLTNTASDVSVAAP